MAVYSVRTVNDAGSWSGEFSRNWQRRYTQTFRVITDNRTDGPVVVSKAVDPNTGRRIPQIGDYYQTSAVEVDRYSFVEKVDPKIEKLIRNANFSGISWIVTVNYGPYDATEFSENPVDWPLIVWWGAHKYERVIDRDINAAAIVNSADEPFATPVLRDDSRPILYVSRNEPVATFNPYLADDMRDTINNADWVHGTGPRKITFPQYFVKFSDRSLDKPTKNPVDGTYYYPCTYAFELDRDKWKKRILDVGYSFLDGSTPPTQQRITGKDGQDLGEPQKLDGSGHRLAATAAPVFLEFDVYEETDFGLFNIDISKAIGM